MVVGAGFDFSCKIWRWTELFAKAWEVDVYLDHSRSETGARLKLESTCVTCSE